MLAVVEQPQGQSLWLSSAPTASPVQPQRRLTSLKNSSTPSRAEGPRGGGEFRRRRLGLFHPPTLVTAAATATSKSGLRPASRPAGLSSCSFFSSLLRFLPALEALIILTTTEKYKLYRICPLSQLAFLEALLSISSLVQFLSHVLSAFYPGTSTYWLGSAFPGSRVRSLAPAGQENISEQRALRQPCTELFAPTRNVQ